MSTGEYTTREFLDDALLYSTKTAIRLGILYSCNGDAPDGDLANEGARLADQINARSEFIVRACNAHDDLMAACARLVREYNLQQPAWPIKSITEQARAALAKAKGQP